MEQFPSLELRRAVVADAVAMATVAAKVNSHPWSEKLYRESIEHGHACWVVYDAGELAAAAVFRQVCDEAELLDVFVAPAWHGRGLATALLRTRIAALPLDAERVFLEVRASNSAAIALYGKLGFGEVGLRRGYYPANPAAGTYPASAGREDAILMALLR